MSSVPVPQIVQPPSILLMGPSGTGKTYSLATLLEAGLEVFLFVTEPHGLETLLDTCAIRKIPLDKLHWKYISPTRPGFDSLFDMAKLATTMDQAALANMKPSYRSDASYIKLIDTCRNFVDDKDGKAYGNISLFDSSRAVVIDSWSGVSAMSMDAAVGNKLVPNPGEWQIAMNQLSKLLLALCSDLKCFFVVTAHIELEEDQITGVRKVMVSTIGRKLAPQIPKFFSEVISVESRTTGSNERTFYWSTNTTNFELKNRSLPVSSSLPPTFAPIIEAYRKRVALVGGATGAATTPSA